MHFSKMVFARKIVDFQDLAITLINSKTVGAVTPSNCLRPIISMIEKSIARGEIATPPVAATGTFHPINDANCTQP
jgi:hypothetical protein